MRIREFPTLVEKAKMVKTLEKDDNMVIRSRVGDSSSRKTKIHQ